MSATKKSIEGFTRQLADALKIGQSLDLDRPGSDIRNIVIAGLGGSGMGANLVESLTFGRIPIPITVCKTYNIPQFVSPHTLFIAFSYSGNTEETVAALNKALLKRAHVIGIASGGKLLDICKEYNLFYIQLPAGSESPRAMLAYNMIALKPLPLLPRWDVLAWENGKRWVQKHEIYKCNWLQPMEISVDPSHLYWLHGDTAHLAPTVDHYEEDHQFTPFEYGIMKRRITPGRKAGDPPVVDQHPLLFPITLRHVFRASKTTGFLLHNVQIRVPVDDAHTQVFVVYFTPNDADKSPADGDTPWEYFPIRDENGEYRLTEVLVQDAMAWETQGAPTDRTQEHLGVGDEGIILLRKVLREQIQGG